MKSRTLITSLTASSVAFAAHSTPALRLGGDVGFYEFVSNNTEGQTQACIGCSVRRGFAIGGDLNLGIDQHVLLAAGFVSAEGNNGYPDAKFLSFRVDYLVLDGVFTPYVGGGIGYLWQGILSEFDQGTPASADGGASVFEVGVALRNISESGGRLALCAQYVWPFFSIRPNAFTGSLPPIKVPFFLFGLQLGL